MVNTPYSIHPFFTNIQAVTLPIYFGLCVIYPPMCHPLAKIIGGLAVRLYSTALDDMDAWHMPRLTELHAPIIAQWFYGLGPSASIRDVFLCIRADDVFMRCSMKSATRRAAVAPSPR